MNRGFICDIFIEKKFRHKGVGEALIKNMVKWFKSKKIRDVELNVYSKNIKALKIYKHLGFKEFDKVMRLQI
jgi:ribosomal protein S18 acetylase RimI-like enzyme